MFCLSTTYFFALSMISRSSALRQCPPTFDPPNVCFVLAYRCPYFFVSFLCVTVFLCCLWSGVFSFSPRVPFLLCPPRFVVYTTLSQFFFLHPVADFQANPLVIAHAVVALLFPPHHYCCSSFLRARLLRLTVFVFRTIRPPPALPFSSWSHRSGVLLGAFPATPRVAPLFSTCSSFPRFAPASVLDQ